jgi:hypothetical protein
MFSIEGKVVGLLDRGFLLDTGGGEPTQVVTQKPGKALGLRRGDRVQVMGGPGGEGVFLSSSAWKEILFGRRSIRVPVNEYETRSWLWWL